MSKEDTSSSGFEMAKQGSHLGFSIGKSVLGALSTAFAENQVPVVPQILDQVKNVLQASEEITIQAIDFSQQQQTTVITTAAPARASKEIIIVD